MKKAEILVSSDVVGVFGDLDQLYRVYASCLPFLGGEQVALEMIAWKHLLLNKNKKVDERVSTRGIHGPIGDPDPSTTLLEKSKYLVFEQLLAKLKPILDAQQKFLEPGQAPNYLLVHESELKSNQKIQTIIDQAQKPHILVENVTSPGSLARTVHLVETLRSAGVQAGVMFDLVHILKEITGAEETLHRLDQKTFNAAWQIALTKATQTIS